MPTYKINAELNGVEIYFESKPQDSLLQELRDGGWRWHSRKKCWYNRNTAATKTFAQSICNSTGNSAASATGQSKNRPPLTNCSDITDGAKTVSFTISSGQTILSTGTITKSENQYTIFSTNNQILCCDCEHMISIHAQACPFCGCPLSYIIEHYYQELSQTALTQPKPQPLSGSQAHSSRQPLSPEAEAALLKRLEKEVDEYGKKRLKTALEYYKQQKDGPKLSEEEAKKRSKRIEELCQKYGLSDSIANIVIKSKISAIDFERRLDRIQYYKNRYPQLNIQLSHFATNDSISDYVASFNNNTEKRCIGNCSTCTREFCILGK